MLTKDETELYDRQIRLWGVNAQSRLRQSKVLMLNFNGVASEVAKILVLAGIDTLTIVDDQPLVADDITSNLFCRTRFGSSNSNGEAKEEKFRTHQVQEKLRRLNPLVKVNVDNTSILDKKPDDFKGYDLVTLHSILTIEQTNSINDVCRANGIKFYLVIDYGFFGFMFNDLGEEFKFTYEQYEDKKQKEINSNTGKHLFNNKQLGAAKNPINFDDENIDVSHDPTDDEDDRDNARPKKRIRLEGPINQKQNENKDDMKHIAGTASYVTFRDMISFKGAKFDRKTSPILFISIAMMKFYSEHKYLPLRASEVSHQDDLSKLNQIVASMKDELNLNEIIFKKLDPEWSKNINGSLSPVSAIMGGMAGQDIIRALSGKDIPICNTFSFDGIEMSGAVERLGIEDKKEGIKEPLVRDFLQIEDSN